MHSPTFPGTFSSQFLMFIGVGTLTNIYFNMKDSNHRDTGRIRIIRNGSLPTFLFELSGIFELKLVLLFKF